MNYLIAKDNCKEIDRDYLSVWFCTENREFPYESIVKTKNDAPISHSPESLLKFVRDIERHILENYPELNI
jgi:hypothetical protein